MTSPAHLEVLSLSPSTAIPPLPHYVDSTIISARHSCKRKNLYGYVHSLYPTGESVHLIAGAALAAGMEAARRITFQAADPHSVTLEDQLHAAFIAFLDEWGDFEPPEKHAKNLVNTFSALRHYLETHPPATDEIQPLRRPDGSPAIEYTFSLELPILHPDGAPMFYVGRFDMLGVYSVPGATLHCILDDKTTASLGQYWADSWDLRGQFIGYIWACRQHGIPLSHAAVRGITIQKTQNEVRTALPEFPIFMIERWEREMIRTVRDIVDDYTHYSQLVAHNSERLFDPRGDVYRYDFADACNSYGGCAFSTLCKAKDPTSYLNNYITHRWNPLAKNPVEEPI